MANEGRNNRWNNRGGHGGNAVYGLGIIGALVYYIGHADSFWWGVLGVLKALIWPVFLVYSALGHVGA